ncbi:Serine/threonine-protein kinase pkn5 [Coelomomyces lativittatus]|nr:Serine/threonine-protein kinase pkn5 [Coelomomyces lativittatus]KAJ1501750.1 Serine/threonine-protein kinase pkn5 [Coelomomyces lativittatus]
MSTPMQVATATLQHATESLRRAETRLNAFMDTNPQDFASAAYIALSAEVTACRVVLAGAQQTLQALEGQSSRISTSVIAGQRITLQEYLKTIPPLPIYSNTLPGPTSTIPPVVRHPQWTLHWETFEQEVMGFVRSEIEPNAQTVSLPAFEMLDEVIQNEVPALQMFISRNYLRPVATHFGGTVVTSEYGNSVGNTDSHVERNGRTIIVNEYKGKWTLNPEWFQNGRIDQSNINSFIRHAVVQLYTYMVVNHLQYGTLTSSHYTFFFKRVKVENAVDGFEQLFISTGMAHDSTNPTVFQSLAYIFSIADGTRFMSPPPSPPRQSPRSSGPLSMRNSPFTVRRAAERANTAADVTHDSASSQDDLYESEYALEDFSINLVLGCGRTKVYYEAKNQLALKAIDLWKQPNMLAELQHEIQIYQMLSDMQGKSIPRLVLHGYWEGGLYCIGFSLCGTVPDALSKSQKESLLSTLDAIHNRGIMHNDIKKENILVDENGMVYLIDFGFATLNSCHETQQNEMQQLLQCIECL